MKWLTVALRAARPVAQPLFAAVVALELASRGVPAECVALVRGVLGGL